MPKKPDHPSEFSSVGSIMQGLFGEAGSNALTQPDAAEKRSAPKKSRGEGANSKLAKAAAEIKAAPHRTDAAYLARELVLCTLPHRNPGQVNAWARHNGNLSLVLQSGVNQKTLEPIGLPYGSVPRLLLLWLVTEAIRTKQRRIPLSRTLNDFLREIGLDPRTGGGKRSDATRLKDQMQRLFACRISFQYSEGDEKKGYEARLNMEITKQSRLWWDFTSPNQGGLFEGEIVLGEAFFEAITATPVPVDFRALRALKQSPFALDLYTWASYRVYTLQKAGHQEVKIPLVSLREQFGVEYSRLDNFKAALEEALAKVQEVFPALDYGFEKQNLILRDGKGRRAIPTREERPTLASSRARELANRISEKTAAWFHIQYPHHDIKAAIEDFNNWREQKGIESANPDAHFKSFVKRWAKPAS